MKPYRRTSISVIAFILMVMFTGSGALAALDDGQDQAALQVVWPDIQLVEITSGLTRPLQVTNANDGSGRLFIVEQDGRIRIWNGSDADTLFLDINGRVRSPADSGGGNEEGLLGLAFPPDYAQKGYFYVYYTNLEGNNQVSRFSLSADPDAADASSEEPIMLFRHPNQANHNGGQITFGPQDGYLYIGTGDGGGSGDPYDNAQDLASPLGKILRINTELNLGQGITGTHHIYLPLIAMAQDNDQKYAIPADNPFVNTPGALPEIWALGLRNPWRFSFDRQTADLYIGDVGQNTLEEVDFAPATSAGGENYGWNILEGTDCYDSASCVPPDNYVPPVAEYTHFSNTCSSITGGYVYRGASFPALQGIYFYADYCVGVFWGLQQDGNNWVNQQLLDLGQGYAGFGEDEAGELYVVNLSSGKLYQLVEATPVR